MRILGIDPGYATIGFGLIEGERAQYRMVTLSLIHICGGGHAHLRGKAA